MLDRQCQLLLCAPHGGYLTKFIEHPERRAVLDEMHVRPFLPYRTPQRLHHFAFVLEPGEAVIEAERFAGLCAAFNHAPPLAAARFHTFEHRGWSLRWELHTEFSTYTFAEPSASVESSLLPDVMDRFGNLFPAGRLLVVVDLAIVEYGNQTNLPEVLFDRANLTVIEAAEGQARVSSDFRANGDGCVRFLVEDFGLSPARAGRLIQRLLELETYRCLALLGLPMARRIDPTVRRIEEALLASSRKLGRYDAGASQELLGQLTALSAELETSIAETSYRFGATRAYGELVQSRLEVIRERDYAGYISFSRILRRRFNPALATCLAIEARQKALSDRLAHAVDLLRTHIQVDVEQQNRSLLSAMNRRGRLQLRLQETVEGLSVAAITYYVVGLVGYVVKGLKDAAVLPRMVSPELAMALTVPLAIIGIWLMLRRARHAWTKHQSNKD